MATFLSSQTRLKTLSLARRLANMLVPKRLYSHVGDYWPLIAITGLGAFLRFYDIDRAGLSNLFYYSTAYSMGLSLSNFFFGAFDPLGTFIMDKPPIALWIQVLLSKLIGFNGVTLIVPMALASTIAIPCLYLAARKVFDPKTSLLSTILLCVFPVSVATARDSSMDPLLTLVLLISALVLHLAVEKRSLGLLILWASLIGIAFNVKYLQAYVILPASMVYILVCWREPVRIALMKWAAAAIVVITVSLSWAIIVDLSPSDARPRVMNDPNDSVISLILNYNGMNRALPQEVVVIEPVQQGTRNHYAAGQFQWGIRNQGFERLFIGSNGPLLGFTVFLAICGLLILATSDRRRLTGPAVFWFSWASIGIIVYTIGNRGPIHYLESSAPAIAVMTAYCMTSTIRAISYSDKLVSRLLWTIPIILAIVFAIISIRNFPGIALATNVACVAGAIGVLGLIKSIRLPKTMFIAITVISLVSIPLASSTWIAIAAPGGAGAIPFPNPLEYAKEKAPSRQPWFAGATAIEYAIARSDSPYTLATDNFNRSAELIANYHEPVLTIWNQFLRTPLYDHASLRVMVDNQTVQYFITKRPNDNRPESWTYIFEWLQSHCIDVGYYESINNNNPTLEYMLGNDILWDCQPAPSLVPYIGIGARPDSLANALRKWDWITNPVRSGTSITP